MPHVLSLVLALNALAACGAPAPDDVPPPDRAEGFESPASVDLVRWRTVVAEHRSPGCANGGDRGGNAARDGEGTGEGTVGGDGGCARAHLEYPEFEGTDALAVALRGWTADRILAPAMFEGEHASSADAVARDFVQAHDRFVLEFPDAAAIGWELDRSVQVTRSSPPVVVLVASEQAYAGGAHPSFWLQHQAFRPETGEPLTLARILRPGAESDVQALLEARFRMDLGLPADAPLTDTGLFEDLPPLDNLDWAPEGLTFHYNPYAVGPWSLGVIRVRLSWDAMAPLLADDVIDLLAPWLSPSSP